MVEIFLAAAVICFEGSCHNALIGQHTPVGEFQLIYGTTEDPGYGGSVLQFHETEEAVFAIHQLWLLKPAQKRDMCIKSSNPKDRIITSGCVNVTVSVYNQLVECCSDHTVVIKK